METHPITQGTGNFCSLRLIKIIQGMIRFSYSLESPGTTILCAVLT